MRTLEIVMTAAAAIAVVAVLIPRFRTRRIMVVVVSAMVIVTVLQVIVEGARWQLAPVYALSALLAGWWVISYLRHPRGRVRRLIDIVIVGLGSLAVLATIALATVMPVFRLPEPTGPYAVGTITDHWVDRSRPELFTAGEDDHRELMAQIWYPAESLSSGQRAPYLQDADVLTPALADLFGLPAPALSQLEHATTHAFEAAPMATDRPAYPVLFVLTGLNGFRAAQSFQAEEFASQGYIVIGLDQPGAAAVTRFPDGRTIPALPREQIYPLINQSWSPQPDPPSLNGESLPDGIIGYFADDVSFAIDRLGDLNRSDPQGILAGRVDLDHLGVSGISWGGAATAQVCADDRRLRACFIMDVQMPADVLRKGLDQPVMFVSRDQATFRREREISGGWPDREITATLATMRQVYEQQRPADSYYVEVPGLFHVDFTDAPLLTPLARSLGLNGSIDPDRAHQILNSYAVAFFDEQLRQKSSALLDGSSDPFPEARLDHRAG